MQNVLAISSVDFHSFRNTFITGLSVAGVHQRLGTVKSVCSSMGCAE